MIDEESAEMIAGAILTSDIENLSVETLDQLAMFEYADDPEVEFGDVKNQGEEAGPGRHGVNTEEEKLAGDTVDA